MFRIAALQLPLALCSYGQNCMTYGGSGTFVGTLILHDEAGYNEFTTLRLTQPICTAPNPKNVNNPGTNHERPHWAISEMQSAVLGAGLDSARLRDRLDRLGGHRVTIQGTLFHSHTGYHRTDVLLGVETIEAVDEAGRQVLLALKPEVKMEEVETYEVTIRAGARLVKEAHEVGSAKPLLPPDLYVRHSMNSG